MTDAFRIPLVKAADQNWPDIDTDKLPVGAVSVPTWQDLAVLVNQVESGS